MRNLVLAAVIILMVGALLGVQALVINDCTSRQTDPKSQPMSDEEYMRVGVVNYLMSNFDNPAFLKPDYCISLEDIAFDNAIKGKDLWIPVAGNTAEEALKTFISEDQSVYTCGQASFWLATNQRDYPRTKYAVGVYKTSYNQYNVSVVVERQNPSTQEMNRNGAFITVEHNPTISDFTPSCYYGYHYARV